MTKYLTLNDITAYKIAFHLSNYVWDIVREWDYFERNTVGMQFVRAVDSNSANIAEGFGRRTKKDKIKFYHYSYGSVKESCDWNEKARIRKLINQQQYTHIIKELQQLPIEINKLIKFTDERMLK